MATIFDSPAKLASAVGQHLGCSEWLVVTQERVNLFADATGDHQWIHVDRQRAKDGPFGACIAHGYLTLSLVNLFLPQIVEVRGIRMGVNYGVDKVRFPAPVKVGARVRAGVEIAEVTDVAGGIQVKMRITVEVEGTEKPACVVESLARWVE